MGVFFGCVIQKMKIMASGPITSWEIGGETVETVSDFILVNARAPSQLTSSLKSAFQTEHGAEAPVESSPGSVNCSVP